MYRVRVWRSLRQGLYSLTLNQDFRRLQCNLQCGRNKQVLKVFLNSSCLNTCVNDCYKDCSQGVQLSIVQTLC